MTAAELLPRLDGVRTTSRGWLARCPAHEDRHPSLVISETDDRVLLHCRAGCTTEAVCEVGGLTLADLFHDRPDHPSRRGSRSAPRPERPEDVEARLWSRAFGLRLRALAVFDASTGCETAEWTDTDFNRAMRAVTRAHDDLRQAEACDTLACEIRGEVLAGRRAAA